MRKRFDLNNSLWLMATYLQPKNTMNPNLRPTVRSLTQLAKEVPKINNYDTQAYIPRETFSEQYKSLQCEVETFYKCFNH